MAPSGGRDRPDPETGKFVVSPYDPKSVEVFRLMAAKASGKDRNGPVTHFFPFAMWTNKLVPPPDQVFTATCIPAPPTPFFVYACSVVVRCCFVHCRCWLGEVHDLLVS